MDRKKVYIIILPQGRGRVTRLTLPRFLMTITMVFLSLSVLVGTYISFDYFSMKQSEHQLARLEKENGEQRSQFMHMADEIVSLAQSLSESEGLDGHDEVINVLRETSRLISTQEQKAERPVPLMSDLILSTGYQNMIREMHDSLDYLRAEINAVALLRDPAAWELALKSEEVPEQASHAKKAAKIFKKNIIKNRLRSIARELGLAPRLALGMAQVESGFDHGVVSSRGAIGVLQVMPQFACEHFEITPEMLFDPEVNIRVGLLHMKSLLERFDDNLELSLAAYNAGAKRVILAGYRVPPIHETREYVKKVKEAMSEYVVSTSLGD
jgi:soluble lytic murein transglycosylase-like protein